MITGIVKGDAIELEFTANVDITDWKIRCEISDNTCQYIKLGTSNVSGGSNTQISIDNALKGVFTIYVDSDKTTNFKDMVEIEIEREDSNGKKLTILQDTIKFEKENITWTSVT